MPGTFDKLCQTVREINRWKRILNTAKPYVLFVITLTPTNQDHLVSTMEIAEDQNENPYFRLSIETDTKINAWIYIPKKFGNPA